MAPPAPLSTAPPSYPIGAPPLDVAVPQGPYLPPAPYNADGSPSAGPPPMPQQGFAPPPQVAPHAGLHGVLVIDGTNRRYELRNGSNVIGRGSDTDLQLLDQGVSRHHLDVQFDGSFATAFDMGSTNGTSVNGHEVKSQLLRHGDVVRVGHTRLVFQQESG
jgi:hypothetical protein